MFSLFWQKANQNGRLLTCDLMSQFSRKKVSPLLASQNFMRVFCLSGNDGKRPDHKIQQILANLRIHDCRSNIMFNRSFYSSLCSRRLEVVGARKNEGARGRQGEKERLPGRPTPESSPAPNLAGSRYVICQKFWQKTSDLAQTKRAAKKRGTFYFLKIANPLFSLRDINLTLGLTPPRRHVVWRDSVGVESSRLGLKSECADFFRQSFLWLLRHTDESQKGRNSCLWLQSRSVLSFFGVV